MAWFKMWNGLIKKTCRYLLQRYLGQFLEENLNLEQLEVDLYNGKATVKNVSLKVEALNKIFETQGWSVEVRGGHVGHLTVNVPWNALMTSESSIEVSDVFINLRPIKRQSDGSSMLESMWSSVSSSMQLAEEFMKQNDGPNSNLEINISAIVGLEKFAETLDNVLNRIKAKLTNTVLRLEYPLANSSRGIAIVVKIKNVNYRNKTGCDKNLTNPQENNINQESADANPKSGVSSETVYLFPTFVKHDIIFNGLRLYTEEFFTKQHFATEPSRFQSFTNEKYKLSENEKFSERIPILEIKDQLEIQFKMKQSENISGPKICLDVEFGFVYTFLAPRQLHLLLKMWDAFFEEELTSLAEKSTNQQKTVKNHCIKQGSEKSHMTGILNKNGNWTSDLSEPMTQGGSEIEYAENDTFKCDIPISSLSSSMSSSNTAVSSARLHRKMGHMETIGEILTFNMRVAGFSGVILHEDILVANNVNMTNISLNDKSQHDMLHLAETFFSSVNENLKVNSKSVNCVCEKNHLYISLLPIFSEGSQHRNGNLLVSTWSITATKLLICECLERKVITLLLFDEAENCPDGFHKRPEIEVILKSTSSSNIEEATSTSFKITLEKSTMELDVTIYDRLSGFLQSSPFGNDVTVTSKGTCTQNIPEVLERSSTEINIISRSLGVKLRFPIIDARPIHDPERSPWWKQNIRSDFLLLLFKELELKFSWSVIHLFANEIDAFYCENNIENKLHVLKTGSDDIKKSTIPKITINIPSSSSLFAALNNGEQTKDINLPFSSERVCRQSDTLHCKRDAAELSESISLPAETEELNTFCENTMQSSKLQISINLPTADITLESKQLYEILYNRLNSDLFMWEPTSPIFKCGFPTNQSVSGLNAIDSAISPEDPYEGLAEKKAETDQKHDKMEKDLCYDKCNIATQSCSISQTNSSQSIYFSTHQENEMEAEEIACKFQPSDCSIDILIGSGLLELFVPIRDVENRVLPGQLGKFDFKVKKLKIFCVNGYQNNNDLAYVCLQLSDVEIFHCGENVSESMQSTFYKIPFGLTKGLNAGNEKREMLSSIIEIKKLRKQKIKRLGITTGIQLLALRHNPVPSSKMWLNQLVDFLDIPDYPIEGFSPFGIISEIQMHLWDCAIDYRPRNFPYRAVMEFGSFTVTSNVVSSVSGCNLRFIVEEGVLSIAPFGISNSGYTDFKIRYIDSSNLVPVLDIGLFDISLWLNDSKNLNCPNVDLRCSIHDAHLRTCYDSGSALAQLIAYIAKDGDFIDSHDDEESNLSFESSIYSEDDIFSSADADTQPVITQKQQERVSLLMADALQEIVTPSDPSFVTDFYPLENEHGIEVYCFPDENKKSQKHILSSTECELKKEFSDILNFESNVMETSYCGKDNAEKPLPQVKADFGDVENKPICEKYQHLSQEEDYCVILEGEESFKSHRGIQNIQIHADPLRIVDNHFRVPIGKPDLLATPNGFPMAVLRYTLCEMTFTWHLYGGKDFPLDSSATGENKRESEPFRMSEAYRHGVSYSKGTKGIHFGKKPKEKLTWKTKGGEHRDYEVLVEIHFSKVRISHEVYPIHTSHASRQVLLINEIEIRDRLQASEINKFLYHPNIKNLSNKSTQHVVVIKALHVRPNPHQSRAQECSLRISLLPIRLHIDQGTLEFLADYFTYIGNDYNTENADVTKEASRSTPINQINAPVMYVDGVPEAVQNLHARKLIETNLHLLMDEDKYKNNKTDNLNQSNATEQLLPIYFREIIFSPEVLICLDYHGRHVELSRGPIAGLLMGLGQLRCSEIRLQKIVCRRGILGFEKLLNYLFKEWLRDIKRNQLSKILSGVGPTHAFIQLFQGVYDLFWLPIEQYQKDGRIIKGLQLGAQSFTARTALAALELTSRIIHLLQFTAETAFDMVSPGPSVRRYKIHKPGKKKRPNRPKDIREGVTNAYIILKEGINDSANTLIETAVVERDQKGYTGAVGAVVRHIPQLVVCPAMLATQATTNILGGVQSSLVPEAKIEAQEKWKEDSD